MDTEALFADIFAIDGAIRYVALYRDGVLQSRQRAGFSHASESESDRYEEILVNPTLLLLARQRGEIDCGGMRFILVRYGHFYQLVASIARGHASICFEPSINPLEFAERAIAAADASA